MAEKKVLSEKEIVKKIKDLKIELLKSPTKRGRVKKEIARLLTMGRNSEVGGRKSVVGNAGKAEVKSGGNKK